MPPFAEVIGLPVAHSKSPALHNFWLKALGLRADYRATKVGKEELQAFLEKRRLDRNWRGCNLTAPLKEAAIPLLDSLSETALAVGAVNIVRREGNILIGDNSDVDGIAAALPPHLVEGRTVAIIGAGGAARSAAHHVIQSGATRVRILTRRASARLGLAGNGHCQIRIRSILDPASLDRANVVVNASPLGMTHSPMPDHLVRAIEKKREGLVFDMVYEPLETELLKAARRARLQRADGLTMLIGQADKPFRAFFEKTPPRSRDHELRSFLAGAGIRWPLVLVGLPGSGKSTIGRMLSSKLGVEFIDSDEVIQRRTGLSIARYFEAHGETAFRALERDVVAELISRHHGVIALGGGAFSSSRTRNKIRQRCTSIWLDVPLDALCSRLAETHARPLLRGSDAMTSLEKLSSKRLPHYSTADLHIRNISFEDTIGRIEEALNALPKTF